MPASHAREVLLFKGSEAKDADAAPKVISASLNRPMLECEAVNDRIDHLTFEVRV